MIHLQTEDSPRAWVGVKPPPGGRVGGCPAVPGWEAGRCHSLYWKAEGAHRQALVCRANRSALALYGSQMHLPSQLGTQTNLIDRPWEGLSMRGGLRP